MINSEHQGTHHPVKAKGQVVPFEALVPPIPPHWVVTVDTLPESWVNLSLLFGTVLLHISEILTNMLNCAPVWTIGKRLLCPSAACFSRSTSRSRDCWAELWLVALTAVWSPVVGWPPLIHPTTDGYLGRFQCFTIKSSVSRVSRVSAWALVPPRYTRSLGIAGHRGHTYSALLGHSEPFSKVVEPA